MQADLARVASSGRLDAIPPILTFQSIVDATVSTPAVVHALYDRLPANGSELVLFDVNHLSGIDVFMQPADRSLVEHASRRTPASLSACDRDESLAETAARSKRRRSSPESSTSRAGRSAWRGRPRSSR